MSAPTGGYHLPPGEATIKNRLEELIETAMGCFVETSTPKSKPRNDRWGSLVVFSSSQLPEFDTIQKEDSPSYQTCGICMKY
jgi:hypothetical protein